MRADPVTVLEPAAPEPPRSVSRPVLYASALIVGAIFWLFAWYADTALAVVSIWERSETFAHGYLIIPISAWMIWRRRHELASLEIRPNVAALPLLGVVGAAWLLGQLAGASVVQQYALVLMIPLLVWTILGTQVVWALAFPLFFLVFAVPFGEFLLPPLMEYTADFTISALRLTGVPVFREGLYFTVPSGRWSVVEACSGLRYLIASVTLGFLYAYLTYRSIARRAVFVAFSVLVPIVANWVRAYMIVMIGHLSGMKYAVGVDHLIYGWIFFGVVMLILFWVGSFWRDDDLPERVVPGAVAHSPPRSPSLKALAAATIAAAVVVAVWPVAASRLEPAAGGTATLRTPPAPSTWVPQQTRLTAWLPSFLPPNAQVNQTYARESERVGLYVGYYLNERQGAELITSRNTLVPSGDSAWARADERRRALSVKGDEITLIETRLRGVSQQLLVWHWYWVDGEFTVNPYRAKFLQAKARLLGRAGDGAVIIVYTDVTENAQAAARLQDFSTAMLPEITATVQHAR